MVYTIDRGDIGQSVPNFSPSSTSIPALVLRAQPRGSIVPQRVLAIAHQDDRDRAAGTGLKAITASRLEDRDGKKAQVEKVKASGASPPVVAEFAAEFQWANRLVEEAWADADRNNSFQAEGRELLNRIAPVLTEVNGIDIPLAKRPTLAAPKISYWKDYVEPQRAVIREVEAEKAREVVPELDDELQNARRAVATVARTTKISFDSGRIRWPDRETVAIQQMLRGPGPVPPRFRGIDVEAVLCRLFPDQITTVLEQSIRDRYDVQHALALSPDDARKRLHDLNARLRAAETIEVEAIWAGIEAGEDLRFRRDTNIRTLLGIATS